MKTLTSLLLLGLTTATVLAQGDLTPPGPPGPTMKTLDQVEARIPVDADSPGIAIDQSTGSYTINQSGSYYLTGNITVTGSSGISITQPNVTLDLNGFTISSTAPTPAGAAVSIGGNNTSVYNGHIQGGVTYDPLATADQFPGAGFQYGIQASSTDFTNLRVRDISVQGVDRSGILLNNPGSGSLVDSCVVHTCGGTGIRAGIVKNSSVSQCGAVGILAGIVTDCRAEVVAGKGIQAENIANCFALSAGISSDDHGIAVAFNVLNSSGTANFGNGIDAIGNATNCFGKSTDGDGINSGSVHNSRGATIRGDGIKADHIANSNGVANTGTGIDGGLVSFCRGTSLNGFGITGQIAVGSTFFPLADVTNTHLMP